MLPTDAPAPGSDQGVFLNVPFDKEYSPLFIALIAGLTGLGRKPHCVLEVPSAGRNRLERIFSLMSSCGASIHDLSRVTPSGDLHLPRFNMPFELGSPTPSPRSLPTASLSWRRSHSGFR